VETAPAVATSGDTAWLLASAALVLLMTAPGLALFYGGLVAQKNLLSTLMHSFMPLCLISVQWVVIGYSLFWGSGGLVGGIEYMFFQGVGQDPLSGQTVPHLAFAVYQCMFAVITPALISGAIAERMRFSAYVLFILLWATLVYDPLAHWIWHADGWLLKRGALDFAGGTVVHISSGVSALVACVVLGKRIGYPRQPFPPHSIPLTVVGGALLWFGWFGFNAGSALTASGLAAQAFVNTHVAAATTGLAWSLIEWVHRGKPTVLGAVTGAVAGLVAITPAAGFVTVQSSLLIGIGAAVVCYLGVNVLKSKLGYDDSLDVFGVHGLGGTWGAIATGIFATKSVNPAGSGLVDGNGAQVVTLITPLRVSPEDEVAGLDLALHGEVAYPDPQGSPTVASPIRDNVTPIRH
jgi:Amt family ammonium transporter